MYCVKCKKAPETSDVQNVVTKKSRNMKRGKCMICECVKTQFVKNPNGGGFVNSLINKRDASSLSRCIFQDITLLDLVQS